MRPGLLHMHRVQDALSLGTYRYDRCRCGAQRTVRVDEPRGYPMLAMNAPLPGQGWVAKEDLEPSA